MREVRRSAIVPHSAQQMYALVDDIEAYPEFLQWCDSAVVDSRSDDLVVATLDLQRGAIKKSFTTRNALVPGESIGLSLVGGPFRHLAGGWRFQQLGDSGCKVSFELDFEFKNRLSDAVFATFFEETCNTLIDAFISRAQSVYGAGVDGSS